MIKILFLAANPINTVPLRLDAESRAIDQALRQASFRDTFEFEQHWAVRIGDLQELLLRHKPHIVHFSGHGSPSSEIILEDDAGNAHPVSQSALKQLFSLLKDNVKCVVLNACYSASQARAIAEAVDCVIGVQDAISDKAAIKFALSFYRALGYGRNFKTAFELGCLEIGLEKHEEETKPQLLALRIDPTQLTLIDENDAKLNVAANHTPIAEIKNKNQSLFGTFWRFLTAGGSRFGRQFTKRHLQLLVLVAMFGLVLAGIQFISDGNRELSVARTPSVTVTPLLKDVSESKIRHISLGDQYIWLTVKKELGLGPTVGLGRLNRQTGGWCLYQHLSTTVGCRDESLPEEDVDSIGAIWADQQEIYVGINLVGIMHGIVDTQAQTTFSSLFSLPEVQVMSMHKDKDDSLWVGTTNGIFQYKDGDVRDHQTILEICKGSTSVDRIEIRDISEAADGLWFATSIGVIRWSNNEAERICYQQDAIVQCQIGDSLAHNNIWSVTIASDQSVWVGTYDGRISHLKPTKNPSLPIKDCWQTEQLPDSPSLYSPNRVSAIEFADDETIWVATLKGLFFRSADEKVWKFYPLDDNPMIFDVECLKDECTYGTSRGLFVSNVP